MKKYTTDLKKVNQKAHGFKNELKQAKLDLAAAEQVAVHARNEVEFSLAQMNKALQYLAELQKVAFMEVFLKVFDHGYNCAGDSYEKQVAELHPSNFQESWFAFLNQLGTPSNHFAQTAVAPQVKLPNLPAVYSSILLPSFNEEEYANQPVEGEDGVDVGVTQGKELGGGGGGGEGEGVVGAKGENAKKGNPQKEQYFPMLLLIFAHKCNILDF